MDQYDCDRTNSIGSDDAVIFVNPTKYSLDRLYYDGQRSAFEEIDEERQDLISVVKINSSIENLRSGAEVEVDAEKGI
jgi:hypothetical protein